MHFCQLLSLSTLALSIGGFAAPTAMPTKQTRAISDLSKRQSLASASAIVSIAQTVVTDIVSLVEDIIDVDQQMHQAESAFTQQTVEALGAEYPNKNILIYHNQDSWYSLSPDAEHAHYELDIGLGFTQGYEIWVFDNGQFQLAGDGGYINWAIYGSFSSPDENGVITFYSLA